MIDRDALIGEVMWRGSLHDEALAEAAVEATLEAVAQHLAPSDTAVIAEQLPARFAARLLGPRSAAALRPDDLYAQLATSEEVSLGLAVEHARAACSVLAESLDTDARSLLARRLPQDWAALFVPVAFAAEADVPPGTVPGHGHTLATGRPGSRQPLSEAPPHAAQSDSVVTANDPHGDTKLSSAAPPGGTAGLASARPGAEYAIADARDERPPR